VSYPDRFRRVSIPVAGLLVLTTALTAVAGCRQTTASPTPAAVTPSTDFGGTDLAWIDITIAMDEQLRPLLALVPQHSQDAHVRALTKQVQGFTDTELSRLRALHNEAKLPAQNPHAGMLMPGMVSADTVSRASTLSGAAFDKLVRDQVKAYLQQGAKLAGSEEKAGIEPRTRALAASVIHTRTEALESVRPMS
jgi:uncharacterized protein (DUF305 family)